jgi:DNA-binding XRE family transcriptional regulator
MDMVGKMAKKNKLKNMREGMLLSKSELARKAGVSPLTIDRIERGFSCRVDTKRKIIQALGLKVSEKGQVFTD